MGGGSALDECREVRNDTVVNMTKWQLLFGPFFPALHPPSSPTTLDLFEAQHTKQLTFNVTNIHTKMPNNDDKRNGNVFIVDYIWLTIRSLAQKRKRQANARTNRFQLGISAFGAFFSRSLSLCSSLSGRRLQFRSALQLMCLILLQAQREWCCLCCRNSSGIDELRIYGRFETCIRRCGFIGWNGSGFGWRERRWGRKGGRRANGRLVDWQYECRGGYVTHLLFWGSEQPHRWLLCIHSSCVPHSRNIHV